MDPRSLLLAFFAFLFALGTGLFYYGFRMILRQRAVENTPKAKTRSLPMGQVAVEGTIETFAEITEAPFSRIPCVFFSYDLQREFEYRDRDGHIRRGWKQLDAGQWSVPFFVRDDTGRVLLDPKGAEFDIDADISLREILADEMPPYVAARTAVPRAEKLRYTERVLRAGDAVYALGFAGDNPHIADTTQTEASGDKMIQARPGSLFIVADKPPNVLIAGTRMMSKIAAYAGVGLMTVGFVGSIYAIYAKL